MSRREKTLLLVGFVLILCSLAILEWLEPTEPQRADPQLHDGKAMNKSPFPQSGFALNISESKRTMTLKNPRNIFAPLKRPEVPKKAQAPPNRPSLPPSPVQPTPSQPTGPSPAELAARQAKEEMQQYKFLGYLTKKGVRQGFLSKGQEIYIVKHGERFKDDLQVKSIGPMAVVLSKHIEQAGTTVETTLPLTQDAF